MFYTYRRKYSEGPGSWEFIDSSLDKDQLTQELKEDPICCFDSEHYRGVEVLTIDLPPKKWLEERIKDYNEAIAYYKETVDEYSKLLKNYSE